MAILTGRALRNYLIREAKKRGLDPQAVLAIATVEGGFYGAVGDHGTSFGPFQLHVGGALPKGLSGANGRAWAQSEKGLNYALDHIAGVAQGLKGYQAVRAIAYQFERPADPAAEVAKAWGVYSGGAPLPAGSTSSASGGSSDGGAAASSPAAAPITGGSNVTSGPSASDLGALSTAEQSLPGILSPGVVPASSSGPQQQTSTWQLLASQPLVDAETQAMFRRVQTAGG